MTKNLLDLKFVDSGLAARLTEKAGPLVEDIRHSLADLDAVMYKDFTEEEKQKARSMMERINRNLKASLTEENEELAPSVYFCHKMIRKTLNSRDIYFFCDFHGNSNKFI